MFKRLLSAAFVISLVQAQDAPKPPAFVAADVHMTPPEYRDVVPGLLRNTQWELRGMTMLNLITRAYGTEADRVIGGPRRLELDRYDIIAKVPPGTKQDAVNPMLKTLLAERFHLVVKEETRSLASFALVLGKGKHKLKPAEDTQSRCSTAPLAGPPAQPGGPPTLATMHLTCKAYTTTMLASILRSLGAPVITGPVSDQTGLTGNWDFELEFSPPALLSAVGGVSTTSMFEAIENQLGLKLEQKKIDQPVFVIQSMNTTPTENAPGIAGLLDPPAPPPSIEVATIKPNPSTTPGTSIGIRNDSQGGAQFEMRGARLNTMLNLAYELTPDRIIGLPAGAETQAFDIVVKLTGQPAGGVFRSIAGPIMIELLKDRFKFVGHLEDRPMDAYKLVAVKPKMTKADPENRASCKSGPAPGAKDPRDQTPGRTQLYTCRNVTMAEFADRLQNMSPLLRAPVIDATKLEGMWDFTLNYSPPDVATIAALNGLPAPVAVAVTPAGAGGLPADPSDALTIFEAISSQLGLKLELEKRPMPVLVIDHLEKAPTEN